LNWSHCNYHEYKPKGFLFAGIAAGLKDSKKKDLALIVAPQNSICSGIFTQSIVKAACIDVCKQRIKKSSGFIRAILINSGHANACNGEIGMRDSLIATRALSRELGLNEEQILICSTGLIGVPIPMNKLLNNLPVLVNSLKVNDFVSASEAILTTDLRPKRIAIETFLDGKNIKIAAFAKGSGMIYPNMATMLSFLTCDVGIEKYKWDKMIKKAAQLSFNAISVDGETSTNDSFLAINSGPKISDKYLPALQEGINYVCQNLAKSIVRDGEGSNCLLEVLVIGISSDSDALKIAKSIINSSLVKTAIHGCDPNWGRIVAAAGNAGIDFVFTNLDLFIGDFQILYHGNLIDFEKEKVAEYMKEKLNGDYLTNDTIKITLNLNNGDGKAKAWGCDLSKKYIEINSEYTT
tara:strand:- start:1045 stop:2268 length:1224 start_codon:yes stop_codon:yes gene_type:complete